MKVIKTILQLFRDYRPLAFFGSISLLMAAVSAAMFIPILQEYMDTGLVPRFPTLIVSGFIFIFSMLMLVCGIILDVIASKHKQLYEILVNLSLKNEK